jgi:hypothetical protein
MVPVWRWQLIPRRGTCEPVQYFERYGKPFRRFTFYKISTVHSRECSRRTSPHDQASYLYLRRWAIRQMSYFVVGKEANVERPCAAAGGHSLYVECREQGEREASPTAAIIDSQSVKSAEKGGPASIRMAMMRAKRSRARSAIFS